MVQVQSKGKPITAKSVGNFLSNNAIIILILLLAIFVGLFKIGRASCRERV